MDVSDARSELRMMKRKDLLKLALNQRMSRSMIGGTVCGFYLHYKRFNFCASDIIGESCLVERLAKLEERHQHGEETDCTTPLIEKIEKIPCSTRKEDCRIQGLF